MRRRKVQNTTHVPRELIHFEPRRWDADPVKALHKWGRARWAYYEDHPDAWPNPLAVLAGVANVKAWHARGRPLYPEYDMGRHA